MFAAFLSKDMTYSCGIFPDLDADLREGRELGAVNGAIGLKRIGGVVKAIKGDKEVEGKGEAKGDGKGEEVEDELEASQLRKIHHIIKKADIRPGHRVLEIGSGWGSFAIEVSTDDSTRDADRRS